MGNASYSTVSRSARYKSSNMATKSRDEIFESREVTEDMDPEGVIVRESRDSEANPKALPVILGLDVTGSMGHIPENLVHNGLPRIMGNLIQKGLTDPALLFLAIGDHEVDRSPLQVGQFESGDEELDKWLTSVYLEGGGGGNMGESYLLAWYFAAYHTVTDHWEKRDKKGYLFTVGDEACLPELPSRAIKSIMGNNEHGDLTKGGLLNEAQQRYNVFHIHVKETSQGRTQSNIDDWKQLMGDNLILLEDHTNLSDVIFEIVYTMEGGEDDIVAPEASEATEPQEETDNDNEMML